MPERTSQMVPRGGLWEAQWRRSIPLPILLVAISITETGIFAYPHGPTTACRYTAVLPSYSVSLRLDGVSGKVHPNDADTCVLSAP